MAGEILTPNMNLPVPAVGETAGPDYATDINTCMSLLDSHDHTTGKGAQITPAGLNINADLAMNANNITQLRSSRFTAQVSPIALPSDLDCLYVSGVDLYYNDGNGNQIRLTQSGSIVGTAGSISGLVAPASASYVSASSTFVWQSAALTSANLDCASILMRNLVASSFALTLSPPNSMGANYSLVLPPLPASQKIMTLDASGNMTAPYSIDNVTLEISSNVIQIKDLGVSTAKLAALSVTAAKIANATITGTQVSNNINLPGSVVQAGSRNVVVNNTNTAVSLAMIRGSVVSNAAGVGEGYSVGHPGTGIYTITYTTALLDIPAVTLGAISVGGSIVTCSAASTTAATIRVFDIAGTPTDGDFFFIIMGERT